METLIWLWVTGVTPPQGALSQLEKGGPFPSPLGRGPAASGIF